MSAKKLSGPSNVQNDMFFRNRSASLSSVKEYHFSESVRAGSNILTRSISCAFFRSKQKDGPVLETTCVKVSKFISPEKRKPNARKSIKYETEPIKTSMAPKGSIGFKAIRLFFKYLFIPLMIGTIYMLLPTNCNKVWDLETMNYDLKSQVFGQNEVLQQLSFHLESFVLNKQHKILIFTGESGVGKTFVTRLIRKSFPWKSNVYDLDEADLSSKIGLSSCGMNLVVIDDIQLKNVKEVLKQTLSLISSPEKPVLIIINFTTRAEETALQLKDIFNQATIIVHNVPFKILSKDAMAQCFSQHSLYRVGLMDSKALDALVDLKMNELGQSSVYTGCKDIENTISSYLKAATV